MRESLVSKREFGLKERLVSAMYDARGPLLNKVSPHVQELLVKGYTVIKVCDDERAEILRKGIWKDVEDMGSGVRENDPNTWGSDRWPQTTHGLLQNQSIGRRRGVCEARVETISVWEENLFTF